MYLERQPALSLSPWIEKLWYCDGYPTVNRRERVLPSGRFQLVADLSDRAALPLLAGMRSEYGIVETAQMQAVMGAVFRPGGTPAFFDWPADDFFNRSIPMDLVWGPRGASLRDQLREACVPSARLRLLEMALLEAMRAGRIRLHPAVGYALREFRVAPSVRRVTEVSGEARLSRRRFAQLFREQVGLTPKLYCRVLRFQEVVKTASSRRKVDWAQVALDGGFCDQSHLTHEFRAFSGMTPGEWLAAPRPFQNHAALD